MMDLFKAIVTTAFQLYDAIMAVLSLFLPVGVAQLFAGLTAIYLAYAIVELLVYGLARLTQLLPKGRMRP